ncbi:MAG: radical SAM protein [Elusimicrobiales bacterium]|nr:radical SAM protein [Elusimicrobiales bacterium]
MKLNNNYIYRKFDDTYYIISANGSGFKLKNTVACMIFEELLKADTVAKAKEAFLSAVPQENRAAAGTDFDTIARLCHEKYGIFLGSNPAIIGKNAEADILKELYVKAGAPSKITKCHIELTDNCNFRCRMCYMGPAIQKTTHRALKTSEFKKILDLLDKDGLIELTLTGGEPLLNPEILEILGLLRGKNFFVGINTNGSVLNEKLLEALLEIRVCSMEVSIYGFSEDVYERVTGRREFAKVLENVKKFFAAGLPVRLKYTLQRDNLQDVRAFKAYCEENGWNYSITRGELMPDITGGQTSGQPLSPEETEELVLGGILSLPDPSEHCDVSGCKLAKSRLTIDANGNASPCEMVRLNFGNVLGENAGDIIGENNKRLQLVAGIPVDRSDKCLTCKVKTYCGHRTCPAAKYAVQGRIGGHYEPACKQAEMFHRIWVKKHENAK